jgi:glycine oxidase
MSAPSPDVVVVGAGLIGLTAAFELATAGLRPLVLDRAGPASGATGVAAGMLAPLAEAHDMPEDVLRTSIASARAYPDLVARVERLGEPCGYRPTGTLLVAADRDQAGDLDQLARAHARLGLAHEVLTVREVLRREPRISPRIAGGLACPEDHAVEPPVFAAALVRAIRALGGEVRPDVGVASIVAGDAAVGGVKLTDGSSVRAPRVVVAAGLASAALVAPWIDLAMRPVKGQVLHLRGAPLLHGVVRTPRVYLVPRGDVLVVGASEEELGEHDRPLAGVTMDLLYEAWRVLPDTFELELDGIRIGHRPCPRDGRPRVQALGPAGLVLATGHHRHGILLAPWTASEVVRLLAG